VGLQSISFRHQIVIYCSATTCKTDALAPGLGARLSGRGHRVILAGPETYQGLRSMGWGFAAWLSQAVADEFPPSPGFWDSGDSSANYPGTMCLQRNRSGRAFRPGAQSAVDPRGPHGTAADTGDRNNKGVGSWVGSVFRPYESEITPDSRPLSCPLRGSIPPNARPNTILLRSVLSRRTRLCH